jgi:triosephosphate isomerase
MNREKIYVANWKMLLSHRQSLQWISQNHDRLKTLSEKIAGSLVICPSFEALSGAHEELARAGIFLGAQNCSAYKMGAYTGQISAESLAEIGCTYAIIGHSESIAYGHETLVEVREKLERLAEAGIIPIVCVGESEQEYQQSATLKSLEQQVKTLFSELHNRPARLVIAYEPRWAIGTNRTPNEDELTAAGAALQSLAQQLLPQIKCTLIYGGSVDANNAPNLKRVE